MAREAGEIARGQAGMVVLRNEAALWNSWVAFERGREFVLNWAAVDLDGGVWLLVHR